MPAHSRPQDGVASLAYVAAIHALPCIQGVDGRTGPAMTWMVWRDPILD